MITIAVLGIIAGISIPILVNVVRGSQETVADKNIKDLNEAVLKFDHANFDIEIPAGGTSSDEEMVVKSLQFRSPSAPGSPYLSSRLQVPTTGDTDTYRAQWNGRTFEMIELGQGGYGIDLLKMSDGGEEVQFENGYVPGRSGQ